MLDTTITQAELDAARDKSERNERANPDRVIRSKIEYPDFEDTGRYLKVLDTAKNLDFLLTKFKAVIRLNLMSRQREISVPGYFISKDDKENSALYLIHDLAVVNYLPTTKLDNHLDSIAYKNQYHPIVDHLKANPWDGEKRLDNFIKTLHTDNEKNTRELVTTWMVCAIAAAHSEEGFINSGVLVLQGKQSIGKTSWIRKLDPVGCGAVKDGAFLNPTDKDSVAQLASFWIAELAEIECIFKKQEIGRLKSFITMAADFIRLPFARRSANIPRRTVYAATVNEANYLVDETGNRRWWTIAVSAIDYNHEFDMTQVWAEAYDSWKHGYPTYLTAEIQARLNETNKEFEKLDEIEERLTGYYDWQTENYKRMRIMEVAQEIGIKEPNATDLKRVSRYAQALSNKPAVKSNGMRYVFVPRFVQSKQQS